MAFVWTGRKEEAARLVAEDKHSNETIATRLGINRSTIDKWKRNPDFQARVTELRQAIREAVLKQGIADKVKRVEALNDRWDRLNQVMSERATDTRHDKEPGWKTGLLVHQVKLDKFGGQIDEYAIDTSLLGELRAHEQQAAKELGQWVERKEMAGPGGGPIPLAQFDLTNATDDDLDALEAILSRLAKPGSGPSGEGAPAAA